MSRTNLWADKRFWRAILTCALFFTATQGRAGLSWEKDKIDLTAGIGQEVVRTSYVFTNTGKRAISVLAIKPSCGCVATSLEKFEYAPGERGEIKVTFDLEMDKGQTIHHRNIKVTTSNAPHSPKTLVLDVREQEAVDVSPEALVWRHGKPPEPREVMIKAGAGVEAISLTPTAQNSNFGVEMKPEVEGQSYRLKITPQNTDAPCDATLVFEVHSPSFERRVTCDIHLKVD